MAINLGRVSLNPRNWDVAATYERLDLVGYGDCGYVALRTVTGVVPHDGEDWLMIVGSGSAVLSESWAIGGTGTRPGEDTDNAKYYAEMAKSIAIGSKGWYPTAEALEESIPEGSEGDWAIVGATKSFWLWTEEGWVSSSVDLSDYYTKSETDKLLENLSVSLESLGITSDMIRKITIGENTPAIDTLDEGGLYFKYASTYGSSEVPSGTWIESEDDIPPGIVWQEMNPSSYRLNDEHYAVDVRCYISAYALKIEFSVVSKTTEEGSAGVQPGSVEIWNSTTSNRLSSKRNDFSYGFGDPTVSYPVLVYFFDEPPGSMLSVYVSGPESTWFYGIIPEGKQTVISGIYANIDGRLCNFLDGVYSYEKLTNKPNIPVIKTGTEEPTTETLFPGEIYLMYTE